MAKPKTSNGRACVVCGKEKRSVRTTPEDPQPKCFECRLEVAKRIFQEEMRVAKAGPTIT